MNLIVNTDGGARGNPGPAGIGVVVWKVENAEMEVVKEYGEFIGEATNNQAEYRALIKALEIVIALDNVESVRFNLDSELVVKQINGEYKMKNEGLKPLFERVNLFLKNMKVNYSVSHVMREKNKEADALVNQAIDEAI